MKDSHIAWQIEQSVACMTAQLVVLQALAEGLHSEQAFDAATIEPNLRTLYENLMRLAQQLRDMLDALTGYTGRLAGLAEELLPKRDDRGT